MENRVRGQQRNEEESEMEQVVGGQEAQCEQKVERLHRIQENIINEGVFKKWLPLVRHVVEQLVEHSRGCSSELERASVLTMTKLMCVSQEYCRSMIPLLFSLLGNRAIDSCIKNNIVVSLGDLLHRFPNEVEPFNRQLYRNLLDPCPKVRRCTLMVITHLILNDMIKLRSEFINVAMLFEDKDPEMQSLASTFFREVNKKDPKYLVNILPEAIVRFSDLSGASGLPIREETYALFARNVLENLDKERSTDLLV